MTRPKWRPHGAKALYIRHSAIARQRSGAECKMPKWRVAAMAVAEGGAGAHAAERHNRRPHVRNSLAFSGFLGQPADFPS